MGASIALLNPREARGLQPGWWPEAPGCQAGDENWKVCHQDIIFSSLSPARNCMRLQVLELDHVSEITQEVAAEVCREGLKGLEMLVLTATPVTPKALLHFNSKHGGMLVGV